MKPNEASCWEKFGALLKAADYSVPRIVGELSGALPDVGPGQP
ncbi:hypothetical protein [Streptomyces sp. NPDC007172]